MSEDSSVIKYRRFPFLPSSSTRAETGGTLFESLIGKDKVSAAALYGKGFLLGTESGSVYVVSFAGELVRRSKVHKKPVNCISVDHEGLFYATCSDDGTVVLQSVLQNAKDDLTYNLGEPVKCVTIENIKKHSPTEGKEGQFKPSKSSRASPSEASPRGKRVSFVAGGSSGMLSKYKASWFNQKHDVLFAGTGTAVGAIAWNGALVAWTDAAQMRVMDITSMTAICYLEAPEGVGVRASFPSSLLWASDTELYVCWADSFRHLEMSHAPARQVSSEEAEPRTSTSTHSAENVIARTVTEWQADFIICGVSNFDADHVAMLGYSPPERDDLSFPNDTGPEQSTDKERGEELDPLNQPELQIINKTSGVAVYIDVLPMVGSVTAGPWSYRMLSSYHAGLSEIALAASVTSTATNDSSTPAGANVSVAMVGMRGGGDLSANWRLADLLGARGGSRNNDPILYVLAPEDIVVARPKDVNDRVTTALENKNLRLAAELAVGDRHNLTRFKFHDILTLYINDLLAAGKDVLAANECVRLIKGDSILWERWVFAFAKANRLHSILSVIPTGALNNESGISSPRLPGMAYDLVLEEFLQASMYHPEHFLRAVEAWAEVRPSLIDIDAWMVRLQGLRQTHPHYVASLGVLYMQKQQYDLAVDCFLEAADRTVDTSPRASGSDSDHRMTKRLMQVFRELTGADSVANEEEDKDGTLHCSTIQQAQGASGLAPASEAHDYAYVFKMLERHSLYSGVSSRILSLVRLDMINALNWLIRHHDRVPVAAVVQQLRGFEPTGEGGVGRGSSDGDDGTNADTNRSRGSIGEKPGRGSPRESGDRHALYWYLHTMFVRHLDTYNTTQYAEYHALQVQLYCEFTPSHAPKQRDEERVKIAPTSASMEDPMALNKALFPRRNLFSAGSRNSGTSGTGGGDGNDGGGLEGPPAFFLYFLKYAYLAPLEVALEGCEARDPPLYREIIFIYAKLGQPERALRLLLQEVGGMKQAVDFVETYRPSAQNSASYGGSSGSSESSGSASTGVGTDLRASMDGTEEVSSQLMNTTISGTGPGQLWHMLVEHCLVDESAMAELLQIVGMCQVNPAYVLRRVPEDMRLPSLRRQLMNLQSLRDFKSYVAQRCNVVLKSDSIGLQKQLNQLQRKSVKFNPGGTRCYTCSRPLFTMSHTTVESPRVSPAEGDEEGQKTSAAEGGMYDRASLAQPSYTNSTPEARVWGKPLPRGIQHSEVVVFSPKVAYHRACFDAVMAGRDGFVHRAEAELAG